MLFSATMTNTLRRSLELPLEILKSQCRVGEIPLCSWFRMSMPWRLCLVAKIGGVYSKILWDWWLRVLCLELKNFAFPLILNFSRFFQNSHLQDGLLWIANLFYPFLRLTINPYYDIPYRYLLPRFATMKYLFRCEWFWGRITKLECQVKSEHLGGQQELVDRR